MDNSFDRTLISYYQFLQSTKCKKYNSILISAWQDDKVINSETFNSFFYNSDKNYNTFVKGFSLSKPFRFAIAESFDQGINDKLQIEMLKYLESKSKDDFRKAVSVNIKKLEGQELVHFVTNLNYNFNLEIFKQDLVDKSLITKYPFDLNFLINQLLILQVKKSILENILNTKKIVWDQGNWAEEFWTIIKNYNLEVEKPSYYNLNNIAKKKYDVSKFLKTKQKSNELGENPLLMVDWKIKNYEEGQLIEILDKLDIKQIDYTSKSKSVTLYGKRGIDGFLQITTN